MGLALTQEKFIEKSKLKHGDRYDYSQVEYKTSHIKVDIICPEHGVFSLEPRKHMYANRGCPKCGRSRCGDYKKFSADIFIQRALDKWGDLYDYSLVNYKNDKTPVTIICKKHGEFQRLPNKHLWSDRGCPNCRATTGEYQVQKWLTDNNIHFVKEYTFKECKDKGLLRFDFYLPDYDVCIEYDGRQHTQDCSDFWKNFNLQDRQKKDRIKTQFCNEKEIGLIRIAYNENVNNILNEQLWKQ